MCNIKYATLVKIAAITNMQRSDFERVYRLTRLIHSVDKRLIVRFVHRSPLSHIAFLVHFQAAVVTTIGFLKDAPRVNCHGFNIYHKNRLILVRIIL